MRDRLTIFGGVVLLMLIPGIGATEDFRAGKDYNELSEPQPTPGGDKIQVIEFFSFGCGHCANLEPHLVEWAASPAASGVALQRVPVAWNQGMEGLARVHYAARMAGASEGAHAAVFKLMHEDKPANLNLEMIADVLADHGVDKAQFVQHFQGAAVSEKVNAAKEMTRRYKVTGVPTLVVDGRYTVQIPAGGDFDRMFAVTDYLVAKSAE